MSKADLEWLSVWGVYIFGAIYTAGVFIAGILTGAEFAWKTALFSAGIGYLAQYSVYLTLIGRLPHRVSNALLLTSIVSGAAAGISLLF